MARARAKTADRAAAGREAPFGLEELFATVESLTGLEVSIYPTAEGTAGPSTIDRLPACYRRHMSEFCRAVKRNARGRGCGGHDAMLTNREAARIGRTFVQVCHAGVAEAIVPIFGSSGHIATAFVGQVVTEAIERDGFEGIWARVKTRGVSRAEFAGIYERVPRMSEAQLLRIGRLLETALRGMVEQMSADAFEREVRLQSFPPIREALAIVKRERCWDVRESEISARVHLSPAYFSRLFKKVTGTNFVDYLTGRRMSEAQNLLHMTTLPVGQIAARLGYARQSYFTHRFRRFAGMTPREYRVNRRRNDGRGK